MTNDRQTYRIKKFLKYLIIATKKHEHKENAHSELNEQLDRISMMMAEKGAKRDHIEEEMGELKQKIQEVLEAESKIMAKDAENNEKSSTLESSVRRVEDKLERYLRERKRRALKLELVEKRINQKLNLSKEQKKRKEMVLIIEKKIDDVEDRLMNLKINGKVGHRKATHLREKIKLYKKMIAKIKAK